MQSQPSRLHLLSTAVTLSCSHTVGRSLNHALTHVASRLSTLIHNHQCARLILLSPLILSGVSDPRPSTMSDDMLEQAKLGQWGRVSTLLAHADQNQIDRIDPHTGATLLHRAAYHGRLDTVKTLIQKRANRNLQDKLHGCTPLHCAAARGFDDICLMLLLSGTDLALCTLVTLPSALSHPSAVVRTRLDRFEWKRQCRQTRQKRRNYFRGSGPGRAL